MGILATLCDTISLLTTLQCSTWLLFSMMILLATLDENIYSHQTLLRRQFSVMGLLARLHNTKWWAYFEKKKCTVPVSTLQCPVPSSTKYPIPRTVHCTVQCPYQGAYNCKLLRYTDAVQNCRNIWFLFMWGTTCNYFYTPIRQPFIIDDHWYEGYFWKD